MLDVQNIKSFRINKLNIVYVALTETKFVGLGIGGVEG